MEGGIIHSSHCPGRPLQMALLLILLTIFGPISTRAQDEYNQDLQKSIAVGSMPRLVRTCDQRTSQEVATFQSRKYPLASVANAACPFRVIKRSEEYCGLKVEAVDLNLPDSFGNCVQAFYRVEGIKGNTIKPQCGSLTGKTFLYDISKVEEVTLLVNALTHLENKFKLLVTQIKCAEFIGEDLNEPGTGTGVQGPIGGAVGPILPEIPQPPAPPPPSHITTTTTTRATTTFIPTTSSPSFSGRCGVKGPEARRRRNLPFYEAISKADFSEESLEDDNEPIPSQYTQANTHPINPFLQGPPLMYWSNFASGLVHVPQVIRLSPDEVPPAVPQVAAVAESPEGRTQKTNKKGRNGSEKYEPTLAISRQDPILTTLDYDGPPNRNSLFQFYAGPPSLLSGRITFGNKAGSVEFPWQIGMTINGKFHCGGSIISRYHIITAAHCVVRYEHNPGLLTITAGTADLSSKARGFVSVKPQKIIVHHGYSRTTLQNDIAIIKLEHPLPFSNRIQPICLPTRNIETDNKRAIITGWGRNEGGKLQSDLHTLASIATTNTECSKRWQANGAPAHFIQNTMLCMDASNGDSCNGDSGGPCIMKKPDGTFEVVGVVSFGSGSCTDADLPGVYTRVGAYLEWIKAQLAN
ncbi:uncharacterized protein LOC143025574 isoform X2 [Oratosquilla oratoria]|uniref:uncharacterized protein LOC143025574 isoform X2 n=1 Tax=Oratosquilla oratoria TaxID=337810 RepID=UPI003F7630A1